MQEREFTIDDLSSPYGQEDVSYFAYGGPVGESMQNEVQPAMQYFSEGGEVDDESPDEEEVEDIGEIPSRPEVPQEFSKGGVVKKAAQLLKELGVAEGKVAGKELTTLQDFHTSLGDSVRERAAKMQQQMDAMEFKYGPGQYVFTESSARKNLSPFEIKAKRLYGDQVMREPHPDHPLLGRVIKDPETGRAKRTPYEPGYLVRQQRPDGWAEFVIPESAIKGAVDGFAKGGLVKKAAEKLAEFLAESRVKERLYHATPKDITEFKPGGDNPKRSGPAIWMTPNKEFQPAAHNIRQVPDNPGYMYGSSSNMFTPGTNVMPLYANIKNPLIATDKNLPEVYEAFGGSPWVMSQEMVNKLKERGHDGLFYYRDGKLEEVVAFDPTQVKSAIGNRGTYNRQEPDIRKAKGGLVYRAQGSPIYGEIADSGPITADTFASFKAKGPSASSVVSESARMLRNIMGEGVSNLESAVRGSVAAIPGSVGDIESIFRESDKTRRFATTEEVLRDYMPGRVTKPTKEAKGFEEVGSYLPLPIPAGTVSKAAGATKRGAKKALEEFGPTTERILEKAVPKMGIVPEGPFIVLPSKLAEIEKSVLEKRGKSESKRVQKAADEVKNLEDQYTEEALREVFSGDNTNLLMVGNPAEFKEFAAKLEEPYRPAVERYWREMSAQGGGAPSVPFLYINKEKSTLPFISGHEGRHRNIAMQELGYPSTLWRLMPRSALREDLPRRTREEYIKALLEQIGEKPLVIPEARWTPETRDKDFVNQRVLDWKQARNLPKPFVRGGEVKKPETTKEPTTPGMFSQASKLFKNLTSSAPADTTLNMAPYESMYTVKDVGSPEKGRKAALNVYSSLLPALMRARFPDYVANSPARVLKEVPRGAENVGEFDVFYRTIALDPEGTNSMLMEPYGKYGYVGMGSNTTTDETLNALGTLLHESMHARTRGAEGKKLSAPHPAEQLKKAMPKDRFDEMIRDIQVSELPSVYAARSPVEVINEYFATATPVKHMVDKDMVTKRTRRYLKEVERLAKKYPELEKTRIDWERPELFFKD